MFKTIIIYLSYLQNIFKAISIFKKIYFLISINHILVIYFIPNDNIYYSGSRQLEFFIKFSKNFKAI